MNLPKPDQSAYLNAKPFPHLVLDDVMGYWEISDVVEQWPKTHESSLNGKDQKHKHYTNSESFMPTAISKFIKIHFQSQEWIMFLEELTGIKGLVMDIRGGYGLHETMPGGALKPHLDYLIHDVTGLQHRVNAILYLNEVQSGGELELYEFNPDHGGYLTNKVSIQPKFNRIAIFNIDSKSWHGHPNPVIGNESRKSIALNYFSLPEKDSIRQQTIFTNGKKNIFKPFIPSVLYKILK